MISMVKKLLEHFMKNNYRRLIKKNLELKKHLRKKVINYMLDGKVVIIHLIVGLTKKIYYNIIARFKVMQQKQIFKIFHMLILQVLH